MIEIPTITDRFPELAHLAPGIADVEADFTDALTRCAIVAAVVAIVERAAEDGDVFVVATALAEEIVAARRDGRDDSQLTLMLLACSVVPLEYAAAYQQYDEAWRWAVTAMAGTVVKDEVQVSVDHEAPLRSGMACSPIAKDLVVRWVGQVAYLAWSAGYMRDDATYLVQRVAPLIPDVLADGAQAYEVANVSHIATWLHRIDDAAADRLVRVLQQTYEDVARPIDVRLAAGRALCAGAGSRSDVPRRDRAVELLDSGWPMSSIDHVQLMSVATEGDASRLRDRLADLVDAARAANAEIEQKTTDPIRRAIARGRLWSMVLGPVADLVADGDTQSALRLIAAWFGHDEHTGRSDAVLVAMRSVGSARWAAGGAMSERAADRQQLHAAFNAVLDVSLVDPAELSGAARLSARGGKPDMAGSAALHAALVEGLHPSVGADLGANAAPVPTGLVNLAFDRAPLSWLVSEAGGPVLPLVVSYQQPRPDRKISRAEIWFGDLTGAEEEAEAVGAVLRDAGRQVDIVSSLIAPVEDFKRAYEDESLDLLWIISHAEFDHRWVSDTVLHLSTQQAIRMDELVALRQPSAQRRLLVLNSCESGVTAGLGGPSTVGLAGMLACGSQAVVSHLWPVGWREAMVFGALLAIGLAGTEGFGDAFASAVKTIQAGPGTIGSELRSHASTAPLADRWDIESMCSFLGSASPCLME